MTHASSTAAIADLVAPAPGEMRAIAAGVYWLRMPLPFALDHINLWVLDDGEGWVIIDTGIATVDVRDAWQRLFVGPLAGRRPRHLICTHFHPDHMGLAGWLCDRWGMPMSATLGEWAFGRMLAIEDDETLRGTALAFYRRAGFDDARLQLVAERGNAYRRRVEPIPSSFRRLRDGDVFDIDGRSWRVIVGLGHSPEHASLYCAETGVLIAGDQVLPRISPNISVWPQEPGADPLRLYLASLKRFADLPAETLVLPSHHAPFIGLRGRLAELAHHHDARLADTLALCSTPRTAADLLERLFRRQLDDHQVFFAVGEALAHLHYLERNNTLRRFADANGREMFVRD
ncbi:MAG: MBL fold metallo-hydrolase [Rhodospirillales bacterium]|nr:MBL fold metallo-hydrolase [Rhodospirillales bacterium]